MNRLRKAVIAGLALAAVGMFMPAAALAHGGGHGGGGMGHAGGFHGFGGFHGGGFHGGGFRHGFGWGGGTGFFFAPGYYDYPYYDGGGCYVVRERVHTRRGWRYRTLEVCE